MKDFSLSNINYNAKKKILTFNFGEGIERVATGIISSQEIVESLMEIISQISEEDE